MKSLRPILAICGLHVLVCLYFLLFSWSGQEKLYTPDSAAYDILAVNLIEYQAFTVEDGPPFTPYTFRTPLYPVFLALHYIIIGHNPIVPVLTQIVINACTIFVLFKIGLMLYGRKTCYWGCILLAFSGVFVLHGLYLLTESLYGFLLSLIVYLLVWFLRAGNDDRIFGLSRPRIPVLMGILLGMLTLCKPSAFFLAFLIAGILLFYGGRTTLQSRVKILVIAGICFVLVLSPWFARNLYHFQVLGLDTVQGFNLYYTTVGSMRASDNNLTLQESMDVLSASEPDALGLNVMELDKRRQQMAVSEFLEHPVDFLAICFFGLSVTLSPISPNALALYMGDSDFEFSQTVTIGKMVAGGEWREALAYTLKGGDTAVPLWLSSAFFTLADSTGKCNW
jgi:4-amino-4-deoxy-L-arabinose transferase-like glycosyltransferase